MSEVEKWERLISMLVAYQLCRSIYRWNEVILSALNIMLPEKWWAIVEVYEHDSKKLLKWAQKCLEKARGQRP